MSIFRPRVGNLSVFLTAVLAAACSAQDYADLVLADNPIAYWRLDDDAQGAVANVGTAPSIVGTAVGGDFLEVGVPGLADPDNPAMRFKGIDEDLFFDEGTLFGGRINISNSPLTNSGGPYTEKTIELWFSADDVDPISQQMLFEQGGSTRGISIYVYEGEVVAGLHNSNNDDGNLSTPWPGGTGAERELAFVKAPIEPNTPYHLAMVYDGDADGFEGTLTGYLNGESMGVVEGLGRLFGHTDPTHIGGAGQTLFEDGGVGTNIDTELRYFQGVIDEVALYNRALSAGRIGVHLGNPISADLDGDGEVGFSDFLLISANFNLATDEGDVDFSEFVDMDDFVIWRNQFDAASAAGEAAAVPEPATGLLAALSLLGLSAFRTRRKSQNAGRTGR